jgi:hypothetical protein
MDDDVAVAIDVYDDMDDDVAADAVTAADMYNDVDDNMAIAVATEADVGAYVDVDVAGDIANDDDMDYDVAADVTIEAHSLNGPISKAGHQFGQKFSNHSIIISIIII